MEITNLMMNNVVSMFSLTDVKTPYEQGQNRTVILFYFILLASPKNKQTNRKNVGRDIATAVGPYSRPGY